MEQRDNSGAIFKAKPNDNPNWPTHEGSCMVNGVEMWISAWVKEGKSGKFFSLAFKPKAARTEPARAAPRAASTAADDSEIPFSPLGMWD